MKFCSVAAVPGPRSRYHGSPSSGKVSSSWRAVHSAVVFRHGKMHSTPPKVRQNYEDEQHAEEHGRDYEKVRGPHVFRETWPEMSAKSGMATFAAAPMYFDDRSFKYRFEVPGLPSFGKKALATRYSSPRETESSHVHRHKS